MKKLMIAAAIVCAAAFAQASCSLTWNGGNNNVFVNAQGEQMEDVANLVLVNLGSSIDWDSVTSANVIPTAGSATVGKSTLKINARGVVNGQVKWDWNASTGGLIDNGDYLALMVDNGDGTYSKLNYYNDGDLTEVGDEAVYYVDGIQNNSWSKTGASIGLTGDYTNVPEPTSGLLLLLGVAGLALRRRRA